MDKKERRHFALLCETIILILDTYYNQGWLPTWLFKRWHHRGRQVAYLKKNIHSLKHSIKVDSSYKTAYDELILILDTHRYFLATHTISERLRLIVQDALIAALNFKSADVVLYERLVLQEKDIKTYLEHFQELQELEEYREHFAKQHALYGVQRALLSPTELTIYAKANIINGKLIEYFGIYSVIKRNIMRIKKELQALIDKQIERGFLTLENCKGLIVRAERIIDACDHNIPEFDDTTLVQYSRYFLETIINTAGILPLGTAKYPEHAILITACYWVDELMQQAQVKVTM